MHEQMFHSNCFGEKTETPVLSVYSNIYIYFIVGLFLLLMGFSTGILNLLIFTVICKNHVLQSVPNIILTSLCISDMLAGFVVVPLISVVSFLTGLRYLELGCKVLSAANFLTFYFVTASYLTQITIWTERYIGIFHPYFYRKWIVKRIIIQSMVILWVLLLLTNLMILFTVNLVHVAFFATHSFPVAIMWCIYVQLKICMVVRRIRCEISPLSCHQRRNDMRTFATSRATKVGFSIFFATLICYAPYSILYVLYYHNLISRAKVILHCSWMTFMVLLNSLCNVVIYSIRMKEIRRAVANYVKG